MAAIGREPAFSCTHPEDLARRYGAREVSERKRREKRQQQVVDAVSAVLRDEDADVLNCIESAIQEDPLLAAPTLTHLAATAVSDLAEATGRSSDEVLTATAQRVFPR